MPAELPPLPEPPPALTEITGRSRAPLQKDAAESGPLPARTVARFPGTEWFFLQLLPSPGFTAGAASSGFSLRWQFTPLLYSWGVHPRISPWRVGLSEPLTRVSGSVEFPLQWEVRPQGSGPVWLAGLRAYLPLAEFGEGWALSLGSALRRGREGSRLENRFEAEAGVWFLFGSFGFTAAYSPGDLLSFHFRIRYF
jgi:hypothetical protein